MTREQETHLKAIWGAITRLRESLNSIEGLRREAIVLQVNVDSWLALVENEFEEFGWEDLETGKKDRSSEA